ncbi:hypothetical protein, partial [Dermacoccus nishinomiyaensis]|uniref:hypothetical protein n=1 Tax=Dermacoccus nishinomiyaensis TaxID=1274 RepID=UPI001C92CFE4
MGMVEEVMEMWVMGVVEGVGGEDGGEVGGVGGEVVVVVVADEVQEGGERVARGEDVEGGVGAGEEFGEGGAEG